MINKVKYEYENLGVTNILTINSPKEIKSLQNFIYKQTKHLLIKHSLNLSIERKLMVPFKNIPPQYEWSNLMNKVNSSKELDNLIKSTGIQNVFKKIFNNKPKLFFISKFRANFPSHQRSTYDWHQDHGSWYMSKEINIKDIMPATMWFSVNGANKNNSIEVVKKSHKNGLLNHENVDGQGYFKIKNKFVLDKKNIIVIKCKPSQCIIFDPLTLHRSISLKNLKPRYSVDIRYYDEFKKGNFGIDFFFKLKKILKKIF